MWLQDIQKRERDSALFGYFTQVFNIAESLCASKVFPVSQSEERWIQGGNTGTSQCAQVDPLIAYHIQMQTLGDYNSLIDSKTPEDSAADVWAREAGGEVQYIGRNTGRDHNQPYKTWT